MKHRNPTLPPRFSSETGNQHLWVHRSCSCLIKRFDLLLLVSFLSMKQKCCITFLSLAWIEYWSCSFMWRVLCADNDVAGFKCMSICKISWSKDRVFLVIWCDRSAWSMGGSVRTDQSDNLPVCFWFVCCVHKFDVHSGFLVCIRICLCFGLRCCVYEFNVISDLRVCLWVCC